jgi:hypothetical protein
MDQFREMVHGLMNQAWEHLTQEMLLLTPEEAEQLPSIA